MLVGHIPGGGGELWIMVHAVHDVQVYGKRVGGAEEEEIQNLGQCLFIV